MNVLLLSAAIATVFCGGAHAQWRVPGRRLSIGDSCQLDDGRRGICRSFQQCPAAIEDIRQGRRPTTCFYDRFVAIPCCPISEQTAVSPPTTKQTPTPTPKPTPRPTPTRRPTPVTSATTPRRPPVQTSAGCVEPVEDWSPSPEEERAMLRLAQQKCVEYRRHVYQLEKVPTLIIDDDQYINRSTCAMDRQPLIIGGVPAAPREFPHMAVIGYGARKDNNWQCGGSLISSRHILTAGHCLRSSAGCARWVLLGALLLNETTYNTEPQEYEIVRRIRHQQYRPPERYNDIAILELNRDVQFTGYVRPACLYIDSATPLGDKGIATGFGRQDWANSEGSNTLMKVSLPFQPYARCNATYTTSFRLPNGLDDNGMLCAGELKGSKDTCQGDSGGPLQTRDLDNCMYQIIGVTSFGSPVCGAENSPAIYTRVSSYVPWIAKTVWT